MNEGDHYQFVERCVEEQLQRLAPAEISVCRRYALYTTPLRRFPTQCFNKACYYMMTHRIKGIEYVFGSSLGGGLGGNHAWVELPGGVVFDGVLQRFYRKDDYYRIECARPWYRYTRSAVLYLIESLTVNGNIDYRWHDPLGLPWAMSAHDPSVEALLVDRRMAERRLAASISKEANP
jgi:hypothetical protein